jgi:tellurium resistance protein TerZ
MSISLDKKTGINLKKGSTISLEKEGRKLEQVYIGLNWGAIVKKSFFGLKTDTEGVDLDGSVSLFDGNKKLLETVYFGRLRSDDGAIVHSGDDRRGDAGKDDGRDNEIIELQLNKITPRVQQIVFYLNSYKGQDFADIPFSKIRIFEGSRHEVKEVFATFNLSAEAAFSGHVAMVLGKLVRTGSNWEFSAIGEPLKTQKITETVELIQQRYL